MAKLSETTRRAVFAGAGGLAAAAAVPALAATPDPLDAIRAEMRSVRARLHHLETRSEDNQADWDAHLDRELALMHAVGALPHTPEAAVVRADALMLLYPDDVKDMVERDDGNIAHRLVLQIVKSLATPG